MPEENNWSKAHNSNLMTGGIMEENLNLYTTDTILIPTLDIERKTVPVFWPCCNRMAAVAIADVMRFEKISPAYKACRKCEEFINDGG